MAKSITPKANDIQKGRTATAPPARPAANPSKYKGGRVAPTPPSKPTKK